MPKASPISKNQRLCTFCLGATGARASGEHIWPNWASELLPVRATKHQYLGKGWNGFALSDRKIDYTRQGSPSGIKVRGVCKKCNETWMSTIEQRSKPILIRLLVGHDKYFRFRGQRLTADSLLDSRLSFGGGVGRADWFEGRRVGDNLGIAAA